MYWSPIRLPCMVTKSSLQSWEIHPQNHYWASTVRDSWLDVPWGATSCCPPFRQPPTSYKACVYGWQRQASSFKSSNRLPPKRSHDFCSLASHEPRFESHRAWMTASTLRLIPPVRRRMSCCDSCCHSRCTAVSNWRMFCTGGSRVCIRRPNMSQICSMGFKSGLMAGQGTEVTASLWR
jgi:hypothetical protein